MSLKRSHPDSTSGNSSSITTQLYTSSIIEDRASTFIAHFSPSTSAKALQAHPSLSTATHRIAAWRIPSAQTTLHGAQRLHETGHDDDGEARAGARVARVLADARVEGALVVGRWYGGTMLGPVRFAHIENCAREAIARFRAGLGGPPAVGEEEARGEEEPLVKKVKTVEERNEERERRDRLVETLRERDESVDVLRGLLADKLAGKESSELAASQSKAKPSYGGMTMDTLLRLEKARDATIGFLLKQIDEAEKVQAEKTRKTDEEDEEAWAAFDELGDQVDGDGDAKNNGIDQVKSILEQTETQKRDEG